MAPLFPGCTKLYVIILVGGVYNWNTPSNYVFSAKF